MEDKRSPVGVSPPDASRQGSAKRLQDPQQQSRGSKVSSTRTNSASVKSRRKTTTKPVKTGREKLDQKETDAADVPATKHPEHSGESVDTKAPGIVQ
ncbi:hypothetical protein MTO96_003781 [Rhipicephalus appendiculatus]